MLKGLSYSTEVLSPRRVRDGRLEAVGEGHQQVVGALAAGAGVDADLLAVGQQAGDVLQFGVAGAQHRLRKCTENGRSSFTVAWLMSAGRITTATPRRLSAAWQARATTRRACSGLCTCSQNTEQLA